MVLQANSLIVSIRKTTRSWGDKSDSEATCSCRVTVVHPTSLVSVTITVIICSQTLQGNAVLKKKSFAFYSL